MTTPAALRELRATATSAGIVIEWHPAEEADRPPAKRWFIVRLRVEPGGATTLERTHFAHASSRSHADLGLRPGCYRYYVGGLNDAGSGPHTIVEVELRSAPMARTSG